MSSSIRNQKICTICGQDCSNSPRFKDEQGRYVHESCYYQNQTVQTAAPTQPSSATLAAAPSKPVERTMPRNPNPPKRNRNSDGGVNDLLALFFSFEGRVSRLQFWMVGLSLVVLNGIVAAISVSSESLVLTLISIILFWPGLAINIKRWHDRDKSGFWVLIGLVPIIGWLWVIIEQGFMKGTDGPNSYGSDPT